MIVETITAVYQNGILKPKKPLNLNEDELVEIQITRQSESQKPVIKLSGALSGYGLDDLTFEEIQSITREMHQQHMDKLLAMFDEPADDE